MSKKQSSKLDLALKPRDLTGEALVQAMVENEELVQGALQGAREIEEGRGVRLKDVLRELGDL